MKSFVKNFINNFLLYFQFLTRIPIKKNLNCTEDNFRQGIYFFPVVGLAMGGLQWGVYKVFSYGFSNSGIVAIFVMLSTIIMTGGLHMDGLGDVFDGFFCFKGNAEKLMEIMKDSRIGTYSCIAIVADMLLRYSAIGEIISKHNALMLVASPVIARLSVVYICTIGKRAKKVSSANIYIKNTDAKGVILAFIIAFAISSLSVGVLNTSILIGSAMVISTLFNAFCNSKIGGLNGDTLGCNFEIVDLSMMLIYIIISS
ncbi:cobalamin-5'-phosphate synthase [Hathewaya proteolytica DSM 3090]|uniref:Adenosylcobinamide-GDP ribazoletransferase n=1 Tax=Hathewaya proteolytica DSM 3090 TaxID=1121331 RepID=A0A1M6Q559_9CLOT|nr:adenosylcobinamide-GDP ribazoletransferase [Hathewaya proteolytica]SHK15394.1 cobalamin-5'-phosphate synthase [Hathewaya proteolytica DSM 3090]